VGVVSGVAVLPLMDAAPIELPNGSWSRMVVTAGSARDATASLGYSRFTPGTALAPVRHETEEFAFVVSGEGELRVDDGVVPFTAGDGLFVPAGVWHAVVNTGEADVVMVFGFPHPDYPPTERQ
jgi:mannose-6-phosphate isomerase-like protein (cupin superfamily)